MQTWGLQIKNNHAYLQGFINFTKEDFDYLFTHMSHIIWQMS